MHGARYEMSWLEEHELHEHYPPTSGTIDVAYFEKC